MQLLEKNALNFNADLFVTNIYKFLITAQHYNTGSA